MKSGVARRPIADMEAYRRRLEARLDPFIASVRRLAWIAREAREGKEERRRSAAAF
jgi:hypothetical protein